MKTKLIFATHLLLSTFFGFCQQVPPSTGFVIQKIEFDPIILEKTPSQLPITITALGRTQFSLNVDDITKNPFLYDWTKLGQSFIDARFLNPYYRRQDANGRDLPQDAISKEMINNLLRRN